MKKAISTEVTRREFIKKSSLIAAGGLLFAFDANKHAFATMPYPKEGPIEIIIGVAVGGATDRGIRGVAPLWSDHLGTPIKYSYKPGASGEVAWTLFVNKPDTGYHIMGGVISIDVLTFGLQKPKGIQLPGNVFFFATISLFPSAISVRADSQYEDIQTLIDAAKKKEINVSVSRWTHPANLGCQILNKKLGTKFVVVPYGGGSKARAALLSGEVDVTTGPVEPIIALMPKTKVLVFLDEENIYKEETNNAPTVKEAVGLDMPSLGSQIGFAARTSFKENYPDRLELLSNTLKETFKDPRFPEYAKKSGFPLNSFQLWDEARSQKYVLEFKKIVDEYLPLLVKHK